jgi:hypothetical protein
MKAIVARVAFNWPIIMFAAGSLSGSLLARWIHTIDVGDFHFYKPAS